MRRVRAYSREERKRLIIHVLAEEVRRGETDGKTCSQIAGKMDIVASTKLRQILDEMVADKIITKDTQPDAGITGYRYVYRLNYEREAYSYPQSNSHAVKRTIALKSAKGTEVLTLS